MTATESPATMTRLIRLTEIEADENYWPRFALNQARVREFAALYREQAASMETGEDEQVIIHGRSGGDRRTDEDGFTKATRGLVTAAIQLHEARRGFLGTRIGGKSTATTALTTARLFRQQYGTEAATALGELASLLTEAQSYVADVED